ncbi:MAG: alkaline phosphatase family protein [Candidatus Sericytochromatia bacterium]
MVKRILSGLAAGLLLAAAGLPATAVPQIPPDPVPDTEASARAAFHRAIAFSYLPDRSGHLFFLTHRFDPVLFQSGNYSFDGFSHLAGKRIAHEGDTHGSVWNYDVEIPLLFYGPGLVTPGQVLEDPATQQDLVPTYARLIGGVPPRDALHGQVLSKPFVAGAAPPRAILTLVLDQGGWQYYRAHPKAWPNLRRLMQQGTLYTRARVSHLDAETAVGHVAIGTGAYPYQHGIISNNFFLGPLGQRSSLLGPDRSPVFINSPTLADAWDLQRKNEPIVFSYAYADRAAIGMAGHGSLYGGGDRDLVFWYDRKTGGLTTNQNYYQLPDYLKNHLIRPYLDKVLDKDRKWFGHNVDNFDGVNNTPAQVAFDADAFLQVLEHEPIGQDETADLVFLTLKATDACGHGFGYESDECGSTFAEEDRQAARIIEAFERKVGRGRALVVLTADHGGAPLAALSGGQGIKSELIRAELNKRLDKLDNGEELFYDMLASQFYVNEAEMKRNGLSWEQLRQVLLDYRQGGETLFLDVLTRRDLVELQLKYGLMD